MTDTVKEVQLRLENPGGEATFCHLLFDKDIIKQARQTKSDRYEFVKD